MLYQNTRHRLTDLPKQLGVAAVYALLIHIGHSHFESDAVIGSFELGSGLALAVLLIFGKRYAGCIFFGALLANAMQAPFMEAVAISSGDTLQALCGAWLLTRNARFDRALHSLNDYLRLIALGGGISVGIGALITITALLVSGFATPETYFRELLDWWMGDMLGIILITPLILVCWQTKNDWREAKRKAETALLLGLIFLAGQIIFLGWFHDSIGHVAKGYVMFLLVTWVAVRLGAGSTVIAINMVAVQGLLGAHHEVGYFASDIAETQLFNYWLYTLALSVVGMALTTFISGQRQSEEALRQSELKFRTLYDSIGDAVHLMDGTGFIDCNKATLGMCGCATKEEFCSKSPIDFSPPEQPCGTPSPVLSDRYIATAMEKGGHRFDWVCKRFDNGKLFDIDVQITAMELDGKPVFLVVARDITEQKRAQIELQRFFDLVPDMVCIASTDGHFKRINRAWQVVLGYTEQEILATPFLDFIHPDDRDATTREVERQMAGETTIQFRNRYRCKDGSYKWLEWDATPAVDKILLFASARDVTESKKAVDLLRASEARLQEIINAMPMSLFIKDPAGNIILMNHACEEQWGIPFSDLRGTGASQFFTPGQIASFLAKDSEMFAGKHLFDFEETVWNATLGENRIVRTYKKPVFNETGNPLYLIVMSIDITESKRIESNLAESESRFREIFNSVSDAIFIHDAKTGRIIDVNHRMCEMYGLTHEEALACGVSDLSAGTLSYSTADAIKKIHLARTTGPQTFDWLARASDGHLFWVEVSLRLAHIGNRQLILALVRDITERKAAEQRLRELSTHILDVREEEKTRIAREIHDELGGTLTALKIDTHWLLRKLPAHDETMALIERIKSISQRIDNAVSATRHIIDNMRPTILDDLGLLAAIEWQAAEFCKNTGVECRVSCIEDEANLDNQRSIALFRILQEALTNVSRHSGASRVEITFLHNENEVALTVCDNGHGIPENHTAASKSYGMLGMTERIVQLGGEITFSNPPDGGFCIEVFLPLPAGNKGEKT